MADWQLPVFTDGQIEKYMTPGLEFGRCPNCESQDVESTGVRPDAPRVEIYMRCLNCYRRWKEVYRITTIVPMKSRKG